MKRLGYTHYVAQGGDWGGGLVEVMAHQAPEGLLGIHSNLPAVFPPDAAEAIASGGSPPQGLPRAGPAPVVGLPGEIPNGGWGHLDSEETPLDSPHAHNSFY